MAAQTKKKKSVLLNIILFISIAVLLVSAGILAWRFISDYQEDQHNTQVEGASAVGFLQEGYQRGFDLSDGAYEFSPEISPVWPERQDIGRLQERYANLNGWIMIPGTKINYPVMMSDNEYYLTHAYDGSALRAGSIFIFDHTPLEPVSRNVVIYGHNMKNGSMFGGLKAYYLNDSFYDQAKYIYIDTKSTRLKYEVFSVFVAQENEEYHKTAFASDEEYVAFLQRMAKRNIRGDTQQDFTADDSIITLVTCTSLGGAGEDDRLIVQARLVEQQEVQ